MASQKRRRSNNRLQVLSVSPGVEHLHITGTRLPTYGQVLLCYMATSEKKRAEDSTKNVKLNNTVEDLVLKEVSHHYSKANIVMKLPYKCAEDIRKIHDEFRRVNKKKNPSRIESFRAKLKTTMPFWPRNIIKLMEDKLSNNLTTKLEKERLREDIPYLKSMMGNRVATYSSGDENHQKLTAAKRKREAEKVSSLKQQKDQHEQISSYSRNFDEINDGEESQEEPFVPPPPKRSHKRTVKVGTTITVPHNVLKSKNLVSTSVRNKVSPTALAGIVSALIDNTGGNKNAVTLSYTRTYSHRLEAIRSIAEEIKKNWRPPTKGIVHWDGKLMQTLDGCGKEERLPILLSGVYLKI